MSILCAMLAALAGALSEKAPAEGPCGSAPPTNLTLESAHAEARYTEEKTLGVLQVLGDQWGIPRDERQAHPLLIVSTSVEQGLFIADTGATEVGPGVFCPAPRSVLIRLSFVDRWIVVAHEATVAPNGNACVAHTLRDHGEKIIRTEDQILVDFVNSFSEEFGGKLTALKQISGPTEAETQAQFASGARKLLEEAIRQLIAKRNSVVSQIINSPKEIQRLQSACEGMVGQTEGVLFGKR